MRVYKQFTAVQERLEIAKNKVFYMIHRGLYCLGYNRHICTAKPGAIGESVMVGNRGPLGETYQFPPPPSLSCPTQGRRSPANPWGTVLSPYTHI